MRVNWFIKFGVHFETFCYDFIKKHDENKAKITEKIHTQKHLNKDKKIMRVNSSVVVGSSFLEYIMRHFVQCDKSQCQILYVDNVYHLVFRKNKCLSPVIVSTSHLKYILRLFIMILLFF